MELNLTIALNEHQWKKLMAAIDTLNANLTAQTAAIATLTQAVLTAIPDINPLPGSGATEAQVQAVADQLAANNAAIVAQTTAINAATTAPVTPPVTPPGT